MTADRRAETQSPSAGWRLSLRRLVLALLSAGLLALCFEPFTLAPLAWTGLVPLFLALRGASATMARTLCFLWGLAFYGMGLGWLVRVFGPAAVGLFAILAAAAWAFGLCYAVAERRLGYGRALLLAPVPWVGVDLLRSELWYFRFPWLQLGFSQVECPAILQVGSAIGVYGLTCTIVLVNAGLAGVVVRRGVRAGACLVGAVMLATALPGKGPVPHPRPTNGFTAAAIQSEASDLEANLALTRRVGADLVAWPEYSLVEYPLDDLRLLARLQAAAREVHAILIVGCKEHIPGADPEAFHNAAVVIDSEGHVLGSYHKHYPVQFFSDGERGRGWPTFATPAGLMGIAICYDMDFAPVFRKLVNAGAEFLVVPTYDALDWGERQHLEHSAMARARAVEVRRWVVRPTSSGVSQIIDPWGNVRECLPVGEEGVISGQIAARTDRSLYVRGGWLLPYVCLGLTVLLLVYGLVTRSQS